MSTVEWWHWVALGLVFAALELASTGGFFILFFGIGALAVGVLALVGLGGPAWVQWLLFTAFSLLSLLVFRNPLLRLLGRLTPPAGEVDSLVGELAVPADDIEPGAVGRAELRGSIWSARNVSSDPLRRGQRCRVERVDGLMVLIVPEGVSR